MTTKQTALRGGATKPLDRAARDITVTGRRAAVVFDAAGALMAAAAIEQARHQVQPHSVSTAAADAHALAQSEHCCRSLLEQAHDAIVLFRPDDEVVLDVNERACETYGFTKAELIGMPLRAISESPSESRALEERQERKSAAPWKEAICNFESTHYRKDGSPIPVEINASLVEYRGQPAVLSINRDVTWRKQAETRLVKAAHREALATIAGGIAHEFNSVLLASVTYLYSVPPGPDGLDKSIAKAAALIQQAQALSASLLELFSGAEQAAPPVLTVRDWLPDCIRHIVCTLPAGATVSLRPIRGSTEVYADPLALEQVFRVLLTNAADASGEKCDIRLSVAAATMPADDQPCTEIRVSDQGAGIAPADRHRVFEPFFSTRKRSRRSGLGLAIASRLVEQVGGTLTYEPNKPKGSTFILRLRATKKANT